MDEFLNPNFTLDEGEDESGIEVDEWKESNEDNILMKDLDPFFLLKISSTFLPFNSSLRIEILFFRLPIFFLMSSNFLSSVSSEARIVDKGNSHESR